MRSRRSPVWVFDLDDTLHHASPHIFPHINRAMTAYIERHLALDHAQATALRQHYWQLWRDLTGFDPPPWR
jgi:putative hydrolase of the HAD superfamily